MFGCQMKLGIRMQVWVVATYRHMVSCAVAAAGKVANMWQGRVIRWSFCHMHSHKSQRGVYATEGGVWMLYNQGGLYAGKDRRAQRVWRREVAHRDSLCMKLLLMLMLPLPLLSPLTGLP